MVYTQKKKERREKKKKKEDFFFLPRPLMVVTGFQSRVGVSHNEAFFFSERSSVAESAEVRGAQISMKSSSRWKS